MSHLNFSQKVSHNHDYHTRDLVFKKIMDEVMAKQRNANMDMYKHYVQDGSFLQCFMDTMKRMTGYDFQKKF